MSPNPKNDNVETRMIGSWTGVLVRLGKAPLILISAKKGFVMCGYLNMETAGKLGDAACMVRGVSTFEEVLSARVVTATAKAKELGVKEGMCGEEALELLS
jgi:uncharacterized protein YunC (DUF1805 family)